MIEPHAGQPDAHPLAAVPDRVDAEELARRLDAVAAEVQSRSLSLAAVARRPRAARRAVRSRRLGRRRRGPQTPGQPRRRLAEMDRLAGDRWRAVFSFSRVCLLDDFSGMTMAMTPRWQDVCCASIPVRDLPVLADLRATAGDPGVDPGGSGLDLLGRRNRRSTRQVLVERLLPLSGVEMFARRGGHWYRPGESLPAFRVPIGDGSGGVPLERVIFPRPMTASAPANAAPEPLALRLVRDGRSQPRPAAAVCCRLDRLADWAERETSARIASLTGAWIADPDGGPEQAEVLVLGEAGMLPASLGGSRFWGMDVMIPLGFRADPELSESALRRLVGAGPDDLVLLDATGYERIPRGAFRPLSRAGIRLAHGGHRRPDDPEGGRRP